MNKINKDCIQRTRPARFIADTFYDQYSGIFTDNRR